MSQGQASRSGSELINVKSLYFAKPKLFFKNIGWYEATSTYIHVQIPFNFSQILDTRSTIEQHYNVLLDKHEEPFKTIAKMTTASSPFRPPLRIFKMSLKRYLKQLKLTCLDDQIASWPLASPLQPWLSILSMHTGLPNSTMRSQHSNQNWIYSPPSPGGKDRCDE